MQSGVRMSYSQAMTIRSEPYHASVTTDLTAPTPAGEQNIVKQDPQSPPLPSREGAAPELSNLKRHLKNRERMVGIQGRKAGTGWWSQYAHQISVQNEQINAENLTWLDLTKLGSTLKDNLLISKNWSFPACSHQQNLCRRIAARGREGQEKIVNVDPQAQVLTTNGWNNATPMLRSWVMSMTQQWKSVWTGMTSTDVTVGASGWELVGTYPDSTNAGQVVHCPNSPSLIHQTRPSNPSASKSTTRPSPNQQHIVNYRWLQWLRGCSRLQKLPGSNQHQRNMEASWWKYWWS
jgi:hypothetical protein